MTALHSAVRNFIEMDERSWIAFNNVFRQYQLAKGDFILRPGQICRHIYFLQTGLLRSFCLKDGDERNVAFALENSFVTDLKSLRSEQSAELAIQALEPSILFGVTKTDLIHLYQHHHQIEAFGRRLLETLLEEQEEQASWFRLYSAKERYDLLAQRQPFLLQRLSLGQVASYLGIRRETLSRIRGLK